ncbi:MAG: enoyl-CoA hydratase-related protein [Acidobacteria bacterium]|nr:enoyl-CoA hydratase-related protein [Acidobacteriota bacterium]
MAEGDFGFALNEINVGVVLPPLVFRLLADAVGVGNARRMVLTGEAVPPSRAREIGLVDKITPPFAVLPRAMRAAMEQK